MANIIEAERRTSVDENGQPIERQVGKPAKTRKKLNDLDVDNMEESDSEEYQANESVFDLFENNWIVTGQK